MCAAYVKQTLFVVLETSQAWVTAASSDLEAFQALVLAKSLQRTLTSRKLFILISENVTPEMR